MASRISSIDTLVGGPEGRAWTAAYGRAAVVGALRDAAATVRAGLRADARAAEQQDGQRDGQADGRTHAAAGSLDAEVLRLTGAALARRGSSSLRRVINATGVVLHTNLGRAPLSDAATAAAAEASGYASIEYDLESGTRGRRDTHAEPLLTELTGADAAVIVNNNAAAVLLVLSALAAGREVIVSRGELVEIGGGFRVPDVMAQSGALLREVGTTNKTRVADYAAAIGPRTALILRVHPSNFHMAGFTARPSVDELAALARELNVPLYEDLGSGLPTPDARFPTEPSARASLAAGASVVSFSGDKLLGGPQAGIIAGARAIVEPIRRHPLMRALRVDKLTYAALDATLRSHAAGRADEEIPIWRMVVMTVDDIDTRARALIASLPAELRTELLDGTSAIGGGSAPDVSLPTRLIALSHPTKSANDLESALRAANPPVIARIQDDRVLLDLRTVAPDDDGRIIDSLHQA